MLKAIKKQFFSGTKGSEMKQKTEQTADMSVELTAQLAHAQEQVVSQASAFQAIQGQFAEMQNSFAELSTKYETAQAALAAVEDAKAALIVAAAEKQLATRKEKVEMAIGTAKAPAVLLATENLDDASFEAIVAAFSANLEAESKSTMFTEVGVAAEAAPVEVDAVSKLAAAFAKKFTPK